MSTPDAPEMPAWLKELQPLLRKLADEIVAHDMAAPWVRDCAAAVPTHVVKSLVDDFRSYSPTLPRPPDTAAQEARPFRWGWVDPPGLKPPDGVDICDRLVDAADRRDKINTAISHALSQPVKEPEPPKK
jgi:hypothetical protein